MEIVKVEDLASYLPAGEYDDGRMALMVRLANGTVSEIVGEDLDPVPDRVFAVALEAAARPMRNPEGASSRTESIDDFSETVRLSDAAAASGVYLTDDEIRRLRGAGPHSSSKVGSIRLGVIGP